MNKLFLDNSLERFEAYFKTRRLAQYLNLYFESRGEEDPKKVIPQILSPKDKKMDGAAAQRGFFSQIIGFKREEFPFGATIEELCWFEYDLGIKVLDSYKRFRNKLGECEALIGEFIQDLSVLKRAIVIDNFKYIDERKHELLFDQKSFNPFLFDRKDLGVCLEWISKQKENFTEIAVKEYLSLQNLIEQIWNI